MKLTIELVPASSWGNNLRFEANLSKDQWDKLRKESYRNARYKCEICGGKGKKWPVECHEIWHYDDQNKTQTLKGLISLCPTCHKAKHIGRTLSVESIDIQIQVLTKISTVNKLNRKQTKEYIESAFSQWDQRSQHEWNLNLFWLKEKLNLS
jgi:hypothetical protein